MAAGHYKTSIVLQMVNYMTIGEKIKHNRIKCGLTQKKLSELTGVAEITIRQYEANKYNPKINNLKKIALALKIELKEFIDI